jgi:hypothetical protein
MSETKTDKTKGQTNQEVELKDLEPQEAKTEEVKGGPGAVFFIGVSG